MVWIPGGSFEMGAKEEHLGPVRAQAEEFPTHRVVLEGFWMDATEVTNAQFRKFVEATGFKTRAERPFSRKDFPNAPEGSLDPGSFVFKQPEFEVDPERSRHDVWWKLVKGADWRHPDGPGSSIEGLDDHPVVSVSAEDAQAYAEWAGKRLPTEAEWEYAARGGAHSQQYIWGDELTPNGTFMANYWQGAFPNENTKADGFLRTAPVKSFPPNAYGLYDMAGNVWEIVKDYYQKGYYEHSPTFDPQGPAVGESVNNTGFPQRIIRGGSFLCTEGYCTGYRPAARQLSDDLSTSHHTGFRCVMDTK